MLNLDFLGKISKEESLDELSLYCDSRFCGEIEGSGRILYDSLNGEIYHCGICFAYESYLRKIDGKKQQELSPKWIKHNEAIELKKQGSLFGVNYIEF